MARHQKQNFFTKNGRALKGFISTNIATIQSAAENVSSLASFADTPKESLASIYTPTFKDVIDRKISRVNKRVGHFFISLDLAKFKRSWVSWSYFSFSLIALVVVLYPMRVYPEIRNKYSIYSSTPLLLGSANYEIYSRDARSQKINQVFREFNCPLEGMGEVFVYEADKYDIPWWLVAAISFQESSCGKRTPEPGGLESYNAWGWAVYGDNVQGFDNWARGVEVVSEYLRDKFYSKGITEPCDIMKIYTPPSNGSWCEGVNHFGDMIKDYKTPEETPVTDSL